MPKLSEDKLKKARVTFLAGNEPARQRIAALTEAHAEAMFTTLDQLRADETMKEIAKTAREIDEDSQVLIFSLAADNAEEFEQLCAQRKAEHKAALGK